MLYDPDQGLVFPLLERHLERSPEKLSSEGLLGGDVEHAAFVLVVVVSHRCSDSAGSVSLREAAEIFNPDQPRALRDPSMDIAMPELKLRTLRH